ncbi:hypothetical protein VU00_11332 [Candidatus Electrothrix marina]|uniref:Uncharacterized protein n=1 Tax=Candidatus Electrothrix marina TaxID=1859130 RepID=A0A444JAP4_9BACT|nr:hypothetical protein VU00_11332 [Candidatus Electrothrix marina]
MGQDRLRIEWLDKADRSVLYAKFALMELAFICHRLLRMSIFTSVAHTAGRFMRDIVS